MKKLNLKTIFLIGSSAIFLISFAMFGVIELQVERIHQANATQDRITKIQSLALISKFNIVQIQQFITDASLTGETDGLKEAKENLESLEKNLIEVKTMDSDFSKMTEEVKQNAEEFFQTGLEMYKAYIGHGKQAGDAIMKRPNNGFDAMSESLAKKMDEFVVKIEKEFDQSNILMDSAEKEMKQWTLFLGLLSLTVTALGLWGIYGRISPLNQIIISLESQSKNLNEASEFVGSTTISLANSTQNQAAAIQETVASMQEMSSMISQTSRHSAESLSTSERGKEEALKGKQVISKLIMAMDDIQASNSKIESLVSMIEEIQSKTKVINDIVFKTQLLSFNASIEAARAGSLGKGFAVVAEEVGKLAEMSGKAASEIRSLLENSTSEVDRIVKDTVDRVKFGKQVSSEVEEAFTLMGSTLSSISENIKTISNANREQEIGVQQTNTAMTSLDVVTRSNVETSDLLNVQASKLTQGAHDLNKTTDAISKIIFGQIKNVQNPSDDFFETSKANSDSEILSENLSSPQSDLTESSEHAA